MNDIHIFILNTLIENDKKAPTEADADAFIEMVTQEGFEPPTL